MRRPERRRPAGVAAASRGHSLAFPFCVVVSYGDAEFRRARGGQFAAGADVGGGPLAVAAEQADRAASFRYGRAGRQRGQRRAWRGVRPAARSGRRAQVRRPGEALIAFTSLPGAHPAAARPPGRQHWVLAHCRLSDGQIAFWPNIRSAARGLAGQPIAYLPSAPTRRSTSSSTLPVLGRSRLASRSLSSALVMPS